MSARRRFEPPWSTISIWNWMLRARSASRSRSAPIRSASSESAATTDGSAALGGDPRGEPVDAAEDVELLRHDVGIEPVDERSAVGLDRDDALALERGQGLANRDGAHPQRLGDLALRDPLAVAQLAEEHELPDVVGHPLPDAAPRRPGPLRTRPTLGGCVGCVASVPPAGEGSVSLLSWIGCMRRKYQISYSLQPGAATPWPPDRTTTRLIGCSIDFPTSGDSSPRIAA